MMLVQPAAKPRKLEGASWVALLTPKPQTTQEGMLEPKLHRSSSAILMLAMPPRSDLGEGRRSSAGETEKKAMFAGCIGL